MPGCGGKRNAVVINCEKSTYIPRVNWLILGTFFRNIPSKLLYLSLTLDPLHNTCDTVWALSSFCGNVINLLIFAFPPQIWQTTMELVRPRCIAVPTQGDRPQGFSPYISAGFPILAGRCGGANLEISLVYGACFVPSSWQPEQYELWEYFKGNPR